MLVFVTDFSPLEGRGSVKVWSDVQYLHWSRPILFGSELYQVLVLAYHAYCFVAFVRFCPLDSENFIEIRHVNYGWAATVLIWSEAYTLLVSGSMYRLSRSVWLVALLERYGGYSLLAICSTTYWNLRNFYYEMLDLGWAVFSRVIVSLQWLKVCWK